MTVGTAFLLLLGAHGSGAAHPPPSKATLRFSDGRFLAAWTDAAGKRQFERLELAPSVPRAPATAFRKDRSFVVWDDRGLTVRVGRRSTTTRFRAIATSPRLRDRADVEATLAAGRELGASALGGAVRAGRYVYLMPRWQSAAGRSWLEALVRVDLDATKPTIEALAVLPGVDFSARPADDLLAERGGSLQVVLRSGSNWGTWTFDPVANSGTFKQLGTGVKFARRVSASSAQFVERNARGGYSAGIVDLDTGSRTCETEGPALWRFADPRSPPIAASSNDAGEGILANLETGARLALPEEARYRRDAGPVVVWVGGAKPAKAWLYDPTDWTPLAWWREGSGAKASSGAGRRTRNGASGGR